jgi:hypothetical protein
MEINVARVEVVSNLADNCCRHLFAPRPQSAEQPEQPPRKTAAYKFAAKPLPAWFSVDRFREALRDRINSVIDGNWESVSTPRGIIWFKLDVLFNALLEASGNHPDVELACLNRQDQGQIIYSALRACGDPCVDWKVIGDGEGHYSTRCKIETGAGEMEELLYLTPIDSRFFRILAGELEDSKSVELKMMVYRITSMPRPDGKHKSKQRR